MSSTRDLIIFQTNPAVHHSVSVGGDSLSRFDLEVDETTIVGGGIGLSDAHRQLRGTIEFITLYLESATNVTGTVLFYKSAMTATTPTIEDQHILDYESIAANEWLSDPDGSDIVVTKSGLDIKYVDIDSSKKFHIGVVLSKGIPAEGFRLMLGWRPDRGGL